MTRSKKIFEIGEFVYVGSHCGVINSREILPNSKHDLYEISGLAGKFQTGHIKSHSTGLKKEKNNLFKESMAKLLLLDKQEIGD